MSDITRVRLNQSSMSFISVSSKSTPASSTGPNKPHVSNQPAKQQLPLKLSSLSSSGTKEFKSNSMSSPLSPQVSSSSFGSVNTPTSSRIEGPAQIFPLKLADKKGSVSGSSGAPVPPMVPHHSRTGSSPAVIQQNAYQTGNPGRTNTYPKVPDRVRIRSSDGVSGQMANAHIPQQQGMHVTGVASAMGQKRIVQQPPSRGQTPPQPPPRHFEKEATNKDEEVIYF